MATSIRNVVLFRDFAFKRNSSVRPPKGSVKYVHPHEREGIVNLVFFVMKVVVLTGVEKREMELYARMVHHSSHSYHNHVSCKGRPVHLQPNIDKLGAVLNNGAMEGYF